MLIGQLSAQAIYTKLVPNRIDILLNEKREGEKKKLYPQPGVEDSVEKVTQNCPEGITVKGNALGPCPLKLAINSVHAGFL